MLRIAGEPAQWGITDYLLANVVDGINYLLYAYVSANSKSRPRQPQPTPRPNTVDNAHRPKMSTPNEVAAFFGGGSVHVARK